VQVRGGAEAGFGPVVDAFRANFADRGDVGAACCLYLGGKPVVDVQAGQTSSGSPYDERTVQVVFSVTKGVTTIAALSLAGAELLDLDQPVGRLWPELGKGEVRSLSIRAVMAHRAGLPSYDAPLNWAEVCGGKSVLQALEQQAPQWTPGSDHGYHAVTFGFLLGELIRRATGRTVGNVIAKLAEKLDLDLWVGLPAEQAHRLAAVHPLRGPLPPVAAERLRALAPGTPGGRALTLNDVLPLGPGRIAYNEHAVLAHELPASGGVASAHSLARLYAAAIGPVDGVLLMSPEIIAAATRPLSSGVDRVLSAQTRFGSGFMLPGPELALLSPRSFGHPGAGGSLAFADPDLGVGFAYTTTAMGPHLVSDPRASALVTAARHCLR